MAHKTKKSLAKRVRITKNGKVLKKRAGQGHFNARESGSITRMKRRTTKWADTNTRTIKRMLSV